MGVFDRMPPDKSPRPKAQIARENHWHFKGTVLAREVHQGTQHLAHLEMTCISTTYGPRGRTDQVNTWSEMD